MALLGESFNCPVDCEPLPNAWPYAIENCVALVLLDGVAFKIST